MSDSEHTPGPWHVGQYEWYVVTDDDSEVGQAWSGDPNFRANARLIAAAPDLLAACEEMVSDLVNRAMLQGLSETQDAMLGRAEAAVAKARGR